MPRPKPPPTPSGSTDLAAKDRTDLAPSFTLPPPALGQKPTPRMSPPISPADRPPGASPQRKRTLSGSHKSKEDVNTMQYDLPPPPSRARKIIQMKPKTGSTSSASPPEPLPSPTTPAKATSGAGSKRKQPSASSAAGRKIARKTAHSIIERRRRSKMNEEFGVLKDMIPACEGVEMHKLAILQAGIEYVRYLEDCIKQMKSDKDQEREQQQFQPQQHDEDSNEDELADELEELQPPRRSTTNTSMDWQFRKASNATDSSSNPSPSLHPQNSHRPILPNISSFTSSPNPRPISATPTPTLLSPAFNAIHFSPDLTRSGASSSQLASMVSKPSPNILPLPQAMISLDRNNSNNSPMSEGRAEATATAALMMLTNDRRPVVENKVADNDRSRNKGMSVRDLLSS